MRSFYLMEMALAYIEEHIFENVTQEEIAAQCCCSLSALQKLFRYVFHVSVKDYIIRRRLTFAAKMLRESRKSVTDIAFDLGYSSPEAFSRAFSRVWGDTPSDFRKKKRKCTGLFPKFDYELTVNGRKGAHDMSDFKPKFDVSELYDYLKDHKGAYIAGFDIRSLVPINEISEKAGDLAIIEAIRRIEKYAGEDMLLLRIGGDEFALATGYTDEKDAQAIIDKVLSENGSCIDFEGKQIPVSLYGSPVRIENLRYSELFGSVYDGLVKASSTL